MLFGNTVGNEDICEKSVVKELRFEEKNNLFVIFLIGTIMQDDGKRKEAMWSHVSLSSKRKRNSKENKIHIKSEKIK